LLDATRYESSNETKDYMSKVAQYYDNSEMNAKCLEYTNLHRYFVFRKRSSTDSDFNKKQKGGKTVKRVDNNSKGCQVKQENAEKYDFSNVNQFKIPDMSNYDDKYSMINSIHKILVSHSILPKSLNVNEFVSDIGMRLVEDHDVSDEYLHNITKNVIINSEITDDNGNNKIKNVLNGLNIFFVERDCNNFYDISCSVKKDSKESDKAVVLMKEGSLYKPLLRKEDKGIKGIFKLNDDMVLYLIENGEAL
jgi:hypothetical protein